MHPNGQLPAYEWAFGDVNPPVHAWAAWRVYQIDRRRHGHHGEGRRVSTIRDSRRAISWITSASTSRNERVDRNESRHCRNHRHELFHEGAALLSGDRRVLHKALGGTSAVDCSTAPFSAKLADLLPPQPDPISPSGTKLTGILLALLARRTLWGTLESVVRTCWLIPKPALGARRI